jgi:4-carboxymuconolactone decarboxylase
MPRIPVISQKDQLSPEHQPEWDGIAASRGRVAGPWPVMLHVPPAAGMVAHLGALLRFDLPLPGAVRELVILATVRELRCDFEWAAHVPLARTEGVREAAITAIRDSSAPAGLTAEEAEYVNYAHQILRKHRVDDEAFHALQQRLGNVGLVELTGLIGYYCLVGTVMDAFEVEPPPGSERLP